MLTFEAMIHELVVALMLGLIGGLIPGPVITAIFTEILQTGFLKSLRIILIALITETVVAIVSLLLFSSMGLSEAFFRGLSILGALVLLWIAFGVWKVKTLDSGKRIHFSLGKLLLIILSNGVLWTYWITICIPKALLLAQDVRHGDFLFMGLVQLGWLLSTLLVAFGFSRFRGIFTRPRVIPILFRIFSLAFVYFALDMLIRSILYFLK